MLTKRLEILFDPKEFEMIKRKAKAEGKSVAGLVRKVLKEKIIEKDIKQKEAILRRLFSPSMETPFDAWEEEKKGIIRGRAKDIETH